MKIKQSESNLEKVDIVVLQMPVNHIYYYLQ